MYDGTLSELKAWWAFDKAETPGKEAYQVNLAKLNHNRKGKFQCSLPLGSHFRHLLRNLLNSAPMTIVFMSELLNHSLKDSFKLTLVHTCSTVLIWVIVSLLKKTLICIWMLLFCAAWRRATAFIFVLNYFHWWNKNGNCQ